eukprot:5175476-Heterocapsa_arctica.AAC.1
MKIRPWLPPAKGGALATASSLKEYPPSGAGHHLLTRVRERIEDSWLQSVVGNIEAHHSHAAAASDSP